MTIRPFDLSELRAAIARYLSIADRKACALVCKAWYTSYQPFIWERLAFDVPASSERTNPPAPDMKDITKNAHMVKHLTIAIIHDTPKEQYEGLLERFDALVTLKAWASDNVGWEALKALVRRNTKLQEVILNDGSRIWRNITDMYLFTAFSDGMHRQLRRLEITCEVTVITLLLILQACPSLDELMVDRSIVAPSEIQSELHEPSVQIPAINLVSEPSFSLQQFHLKANASDPLLAPLLIWCPRLRRLGFNALSDGLHQDLCTLLQANGLPQLDTVHFAAQFFGCRRHSDILRSIPPLQLRDVEIEAPYSEMVSAVYERHMPTLERIRLTRVTTPMAFNGFLFCCQRIKHVEVSMAGEMRADVRYLIGDPWVCRDLEVFDVESLELAMEVPQSEAGDVTREWLLEQGAKEKNEEAPGRSEWEQAQIVFMRRLGEMTKLRKLRIGAARKSSSYSSPSSLTWSLSTGFAYLAELSALEEFDLGAQSKVEGIDELEFMKDCWPSLKKMACAELAPEERDWLNEHWPSLTVEARMTSSE